jgi:VanZ family protein
MQTQDGSKRLTRRRVIAGILAVLCAAAIFIFSHIPGESYPSHPGFLNNVAHFCEYLVLATLLTVALTGGRLKTWHVVLLALVLASAYAASDEFHQYFIPGRTPDIMDWATDTIGGTAGATLTTLLYTPGSRK